MKNIAFFIVMFSILISACKNDKTSKTNNPFANCKCGAPTPIFKEQLPAYIAARNFTITSTAGVEVVKLTNGTTLQIEQTGCNDIKQEFSFIYTDEKFKQYSDALWIQNAIDEFRKIGSFSSNFQPFTLWGNALDAFKDGIKIGEQKELEKGFFMKIDKIISDKECTMIVTVFADSCE